MSTFLDFTAATLLLLLTPGPTNTLMALAGYSQGIRHSLPLIFTEIAGYLAIIVPVAIVAAPFFATHPGFSLAANFGASLWVLFLSYRLWFKRLDGDQVGNVTARDILITTMLNPKALIIAIVIMPHGKPATLLPWLVLFVGLVIFAASGWISLGHSVASGKGFALKPHAMQRISATCLLVFAAVLATSSIRAMA